MQFFFVVRTVCFVVICGMLTFTLTRVDFVDEPFYASKKRDSAPPPCPQIGDIRQHATQLKQTWEVILKGINSYLKKPDKEAFTNPESTESCQWKYKNSVTELYTYYNTNVVPAVNAQIKGVTKMIDAKKKQDETNKKLHEHTKQLSSVK
jgi:hypothetical protein